MVNAPTWARALGRVVGAGEPSSPRSPAAACNAAPSTRWSTSRPRSSATSMSTTSAPSPSFGPPIPTASSKRSTEGAKRWRQTTTTFSRAGCKELNTELISNSHWRSGEGGLHAWRRFDRTMGHPRPVPRSTSVLRCTEMACGSPLQLWNAFERIFFQTTPMCSWPIARITSRSSPRSASDHVAGWPFHAPSGRHPLGANGSAAVGQATAPLRQRLDRESNSLLPPPTRPCGQSLCPLIGAEKPRNSAVFRGRPCTLGQGRRLEISL